MTQIVRVDPPIHFVTPKGPAIAHFMIWTGVENNIMWVCIQDESGECWTWENAECRATLNRTLGRIELSKIKTYDRKEL